MTALAAADREALAYVWHDVTCPESSGCRDRRLHALAGSGVTFDLIVRAVEASGLLAKAKAAGLREAADDMVTDWAPVWGGPGMWFTTGNAVAELVADTLRSMAMELEP